MIVYSFVMGMKGKEDEDDADAELKKRMITDNAEDEVDEQAGDAMTMMNVSNDFGLLRLMIFSSNTCICRKILSVLSVKVECRD